MSLIKNIQILNKDGVLSEEIPFSVQARNVILSTGETLQQKLQQIIEALQAKIHNTRVEGTKIMLTRGDSLVLNLEVQESDGTPYTPVEGDSIRFAMKRNYNDAEPVLVKNISTLTLQLLINPEDTQNLDFGTYKYDIQMTRNNGTVDTIIPRSDFVILEEVY